MKIDHIDHLVLTVADIETTCKFYSDILGMEIVTVRDRTALKFGGQKINLHQKGKEFDPKAKYPTPGSGDLCLITLETIEHVVAELKQKNITIEEGIVERSGARGKIRSVYFRDPDQNLIEVSNY